ncbi:MAG: hypothetical protein EHM18_03300 [Acidobacteria bacterium]|nr:MAG: hypothetical protein EHM18_03300 [Acidobacteriota bacterium]
MDPVANRAVKMDALDGLKATGGIAEDCQVVLYSNVVALTAANLPADFDLVVVAGMVAQTTLTPSDGYDTGDGVIEAAVPTVPFVASSLTGLPLTIQGYVILNTAGTAVLSAEEFDDPVPIDQIGDGVSVDARLRWGS